MDLKLFCSRKLNILNHKGLISGTKRTVLFSCVFVFIHIFCMVSKASFEDSLIEEIEIQQTEEIQQTDGNEKEDSGIEELDTESYEAEEVETEGSGAAKSGASVPASTLSGESGSGIVMEISGTGGFAVDEGKRPDDVFSVVLPTMRSEDYDFLMDPHSLMGRAESGNKRFEDASVYFRHEGDPVIYKDTSRTAMFLNRGSKPVIVTINISVKDDGKKILTYTDIEKVESDSRNNISFALIPATFGYADMTSASGLVSTGLTSEQMISIDETGRAEASFYLPSLERSGSDEGDRMRTSVTESGSGASVPKLNETSVPMTGFAIKGACNRLADWDKFEEAYKDGYRFNIVVNYSVREVSETELKVFKEESRIDEKSGLILRSLDENGSRQSD